MTDRPPAFVVVSSPHARPRNDPPSACPPEDFEALRSMPLFALQELGLRRWGRQEDARGVEFGPMLWLLPGEWYAKIPNGFRLVSISFEEEAFVAGVTDNDTRFGCLAYGILREEA